MSAALLGVVAVVLLASGMGHARRPAELASALARHDVLPGRLRPATARLLPAAELGLGVALAVTLPTGAWGAARVAGVAAATLCLAFATYLHVAARAPEASGMPCGCGLGDAPLGLWVTVRALLLAALATVGALTLGSTPADPTAVEVAVTLAAVLSLAVSVALLPVARATTRPARS